jgi:hypothetical protein
MTLAMAFPARRSRSTYQSICARHYINQQSRYVETEYKLEIGTAQNTQLAKALSTGTEKGIFVLPKGG